MIGLEVPKRLFFAAPLSKTLQSPKNLINVLGASGGSNSFIQPQQRCPSEQGRQVVAPRMGQLRWNAISRGRLGAFCITTSARAIPSRKEKLHYNSLWRASVTDGTIPAVVDHLLTIAQSPIYTFLFWFYKQSSVLIQSGNRSAPWPRRVLARRTKHFRCVWGFFRSKSFQCNETTVSRPQRIFSNAIFSPRLRTKSTV